MRAPGHPVPRAIGRCATLLLLLLIRGYQRVLSPILAAAFRSQCRFYPSCSEYAHVSIARFGLRRGIPLTLGRLCRCHPFHPGGIDHPPELRS